MATHERGSTVGQTTTDSGFVPFCECGSLCYPSGVNNPDWWVCDECDETQPQTAAQGHVITYEQREQSTPVLAGGGDRGLPTTDTECPNCGHDEAYWDIQQLRAADESPTILYICTECGQTTRED